MNVDEKGAYIKAVKCLQSKPAIQPAYRQAVSRFDEFQAHYMKQADSVQDLVNIPTFRSQQAFLTL